MATSPMTTTTERVRGRPGRPPNPNKAPRPEQMEPLDLHLGYRIRGARQLRGMTRRQLAGKMGVGEQAIEKYELGLSRVLASRLYDIAIITDVPVKWFYEEFNPREPADAKHLDAMCRAMTPENMKLFQGLERLTRNQQNTVLQMIDGLIMQNEQRQQQQQDIPPAVGAA